MSGSNPVGEPTPYLIHCVRDECFGSCGTSTYLTEQQYLRQLSDPDRGWRCPSCGCYPCNWDDENYNLWASKEQGASP